MIFPTDVLVIIGIFIVCTCISFFLGKSKIVALIFALLGAIPLFQSFPFIKQLTFAKGALPEALNVTGIFLVFVIALYFLFDQYVVGDFVENAFLKSVLTGFLCTAFIVAIIQFVLPFEAVYNFGPNIDQWFSGNFGLFWWLFVPLGVLFFV